MTWEPLQNLIDKQAFNSNISIKSYFEILTIEELLHDDFPIGTKTFKIGVKNSQKLSSYLEK